MTPCPWYASPARFPRGWYTDSSCNNVFDSNTGITKNITLYAFWIHSSITYRLHENVIRLEAGTNGTFGTSGEYVLFGDYPQSLLTDNTVTVDETITMKLGSWNVYGGSDGNLYYKLGSNYYKIEPIKWRVISRNENNIAVLLAENILDMSAYGYVEDEYSVYSVSLIHGLLVVNFLPTAFTLSAQSLIEVTTIDSDTIEYYSGNYYNGYSNDKIYLLKQSDVFESSCFPNDNYRKKTYTGFSAYKCGTFQGNIGCWWIRTSYLINNNGNFSYLASWVSQDGTLQDSIFVSTYDGGVVPALSIYLPPAETN